MAIFTSKSTQGFYDSDIHSVMPDDAVEITREEHRALLAGQSEGRIIYWSEDVPGLVDRPGPTTDELAEQARRKRDQLLAACDWTQVADAPVDQAAWRAYRQALREVPDQSGFPAAINWPVSP